MLPHPQAEQVVFKSILKFAIQIVEFADALLSRLKTIP